MTEQHEGGIDTRELSRLVSRWRSRAEIFGEDDVVAERTAKLCADELEEVIEDA